MRKLIILFIASVFALFAACTCAQPPAPQHNVKGVAPPSAASVTLLTTWDGVTGSAPAGSLAVVDTTQRGAVTVVMAAGGDGGAITATVQFEGTLDGTTWWPVYMLPMAGGTLVANATAVGQWTWNPSGATQFRVRCSALTGGTPQVTVTTSGPSSAAGDIAIIGTVTVQFPDSGALGVTDPAVENNTAALLDGGGTLHADLVNLLTQLQTVNDGGPLATQVTIAAILAQLQTVNDGGPLATQATLASALTQLQTINDGGPLATQATLASILSTLTGGPVSAGSSQSFVIAKPIAPVVYQDGGAVLTTGASYTAGPYAAIPLGAANVTFWVTYTGIASTSQLGYRVNLYYAADAGAGGVSRILNSSPSISGSVATQTSYKSAAVLAETGTTTVTVPISVSLSGGVVGVSLDLQEAVQPDAGSTYSVAVTWSYN